MPIPGQMFPVLLTMEPDDSSDLPADQQGGRFSFSAPRTLEVHRLIISGPSVTVRDLIIQPLGQLPYPVSSPGRRLESGDTFIVLASWPRPSAGERLRAVLGSYLPAWLFGRLPAPLCSWLRPAPVQIAAACVSAPAPEFY